MDSKFDLKRLFETIFAPQLGERVCILIDLADPHEVINFAFLNNPNYPVQQRAYHVFYQGLRALKHMCDFFAYQATGGSNLELPPTVISPTGITLNLEKDIYPCYDIILCISDYSATAPLTAAAKRHHFRGSTMHGLNDIVLQSGLSVDYLEVSRQAELLRQGLSGASHIEIDFSVLGHQAHLTIDLKEQEAQKSHGLCPQAPDIVNLPAGEVYFVPHDAHGSFPIQFDNGTLGLILVANGKAHQITLIQGDPATIAAFQHKLDTDPNTGVLGELGFGTQTLPHSGADIQDEKIFGTFHLATGRNDHLTGPITHHHFHNPKNATHEDILFSSTKTPRIQVTQVRMHRHGQTHTLIENYQPSAYLLNLLH